MELQKTAITAAAQVAIIEPALSEFAKLTLTDAKGYFKPFKFPWAFEAYKTQMVHMNWTVEEVPMAQDVKDWHAMSGKDRNLLTQLFRFFTAGDVDVGQAYIDLFLPFFKNEEIRMMLGAFAATESLHVDAYSTLLETVGMPEVEYQAFRQYEEMAAKHDYVSRFKGGTEEEIALAMAVFSAFTEGLQLFSTFAILMNYSRGDLPSGARMTGMNQIVAWSIRDETHHVDSMIRLFRQFIAERPHLWTNALKAKITEVCMNMVRLEDDFIDLAMAEGEPEGLTASEIKQFIRYMANRRLEALGVEAAFPGAKNPLVWLDHILNGVEHTNIFENRATAYARGALQGNWDRDVWAQKAVEKLVAMTAGNSSVLATEPEAAGVAVGAWVD